MKGNEITRKTESFFRDLNVVNWENRIEFADGHNVRKLDLSKLRLRDIPHEFTEFRGIQEVDLSYNELENVPEVLFRLESLRELDLRGNKIKDIPFERIRGIHLKLDENPIPKRILHNLRYLEFRAQYLQEHLKERENEKRRATELLQDFFTRLKPDYPYPFSFSQFYTLKTCKLKWFLDYFLDLRRFEIGEPSSIMVYGKEFHEHVQNSLRVVQEIPFRVALEIGEYEEASRFIEDFINSWGKYGFQKQIRNIKLEEYVEGAVRQVEVGGIKFWMKRIGIIDMLWELEDGSVFIWDLKTSRSTSGKYRHLQQTYFYKGILEDLGYEVDGVGILYPEIQDYIIRFNRKIPKQDPRMRKLQSRSLMSLEKGIQKHFTDVFSQEIQSQFSFFTCPFCNYFEYGKNMCRRGLQGDRFLKWVSREEEFIALLEGREE